MYPFFPIPSGLLAALVVAVSRCVGNNILFSSSADDELKSGEDVLKNVNMDELVKKLIREIKRQSPEVVKAMENIDKEEVVSGTVDSIYLHQIAVAQEFLNENHNADLSRIQRLLQKMLPKRYNCAIIQLKEHQAPATIYNIYGGQHLHAPNAKEAEQKLEKK